MKTDYTTPSLFRGIDIPEPPPPKTKLQKAQEGIKASFNAAPSDWKEKVEEFLTASSFLRGHAGGLLCEHLREAFFKHMETTEEAYGVKGQAWAGLMKSFVTKKLIQPTSWQPSANGRYAMGYKPIQ